MHEAQKSGRGGCQCCHFVNASLGVLRRHVGSRIKSGCRLISAIYACLVLTRRNRSFVLRFPCFIFPFFAGKSTNITMNNAEFEELQKNIFYSNKYYDDEYEYRHVVLPNEIAKLVPKTHLMSEAEWRGIGVKQSRGWVHYMVHAPEPHILLFKRPITTPPISNMDKC